MAREGPSVPTAREVVGGLATLVLYLVLAWLSATVAVLDTLTVWYAPAGLAIALGILQGWRALPAMALGEVLVGLLLFGVGPDFGWLVVPNGLAYASVYVGAGAAIRATGAIGDAPDGRRPAVLAVGAVAATVAGALVGVGFQALAGVTGAAAAPQALLVWWLGDLVGVAGIGVTLVTIAVRQRRGARWWAVAETPVATSIALVLLPSVLLVLVPLVTDGVAPFAAAVFLPMLLLAFRGGVAGVALSAPVTSFVMTLVASRSYSSDVLARTDLQFVLVLLLVTSLVIGLVAEANRELRRRVRLRERHLAQAQRQARTGSFRWDVPDDTVEWSDGLYALFGTERGPVTAQDYLERLHPEDRARVAAAIERALVDGTPAEHTYRVVRDDGTTVVVRARLQPRSYDGRVVELLGTCTDVTQEEETAQRLARAMAAEQAARSTEREAREVITRTERIKDALLVAVSHEVRTPLTVLHAAIETLRREELRDQRIGDQELILDRLQHNLDRLHRVLEDLLDVDRIGRGVVQPVRRPCDVASLCEDVVDHLDLGDTDVTVDLPHDLVPVDARLVSRILEHLLANAARHGGESVLVSAEVEEAALLLRVDDDGPGLEEEDRERVFAAFSHGDVPAHSPGTGVGLYLVARFAELHGGRAWVTDCPAGGSSFRVELALPRAEHVAG